MNFQPLQLRPEQPRVVPEPPGAPYWRAFERRSTYQHFGQVRCIAISPVEPHAIAVASHEAVTLYNAVTHEQIRQLTDVKAGGALSCGFRSDGRLLAVSGEDGTIRITPLHTALKFVRELKGHTKAVHHVEFLCNKVHVLSASNDSTAIVWDLGTEQPVATLRGHTDYVRRAIGHPFQPSLVSTSSYDHTVRLWDTRHSDTKPVAILTHDAPVETLAYHPTGNFIATAAQSTLSVWNCVTRRADQVDSELAPSASPDFHGANHAKTITGVTYTHSGEYLLSVGLDRYLKVYETTGYTVAHTIKEDAPCICVALAPDERDLIVGQQDGKCVFRGRDATPGVDSTAPPRTTAPSGLLTKPQPTWDVVAGTRGYLTPYESTRLTWDRPVKAPLEENEWRIPKRRRALLKPYDRCLQKFKAHEALDCVLAAENTSPRLLCTVLEELQMRNLLRIALGGRSSRTLLPVLRAIQKSLCHPDYCGMLATTLELILEAYADCAHHSPDVFKVLKHLGMEIQQYVSNQAPLIISIDGMAEMLLCGRAAQVHQRAQVLREPPPPEEVGGAGVSSTTTPPADAEPTAHTEEVGGGGPPTSERTGGAGVTPPKKKAKKRPADASEPPPPTKKKKKSGKQK